VQVSVQMTAFLKLNNLFVIKINLIELAKNCEMLVNGEDRWIEIPISRQNDGF
jgi:hypothetical protein